MMNFWKFQFYRVHSSAKLRQTVSAIDMVDGALYKLGLGLLKNIVDNKCGALKFCVDAIEMRKGTCFLNFSKTKKKTGICIENTTIKLDV